MILDKIRTIIESIWLNFVDLANTDWSLVNFGKDYFVTRAALLILAAFLLKLLWPFLRDRREKSFYEQPGYCFQKEDRPGIIFRLFSFLPIAMAVGAAFWLMVAIADPYITQSRQREFKQTKELIIARDASVSSGFRFKNSPQTRAEIINEFLLRLVARQEKKNLRIAYMVFASSPFVIADFTTDMKSLAFSIHNGPQVIADPDTPKLYPKEFLTKDFTPEPFGGDSELHLGLYRAIKLLEERGDPKITLELKENPSVKRRSILIITDGAAAKDPEEQFKEIKKHNIVPYLVFIDPAHEVEKRVHGPNSPQAQLPEKLLRQVKKYGGEYFMITDRSTIEKVSERLDYLHALNTGVEFYTIDKHIYRMPLMVSIAFFLIAFAARVIFWALQEMV